MAVTGKDIPTPRSRGRAMQRVTSGVNAVIYGATATLAALAVYLLIGSLLSWAQVRFDDMRYGRPRTTHLEGFVGRPEEATGRPTHFIALNLRRQVIVLELPGGDADQVRSLPGPYLFGADEELTPVQLALKDTDADGNVDLLINVRNEQVIYLNKDGSFRLPTGEEQAQLAQELSP